MWSSLYGTINHFNLEITLISELLEEMVFHLIYTSSSLSIQYPLFIALDRVLKASVSDLLLSDFQNSGCCFFIFLA